MLWAGAIVLVTTVPFRLEGARGLHVERLRVPLGLAGVASPAASALPVIFLRTWFPRLGHVLAPVALFDWWYFVTKDVRAHWPLTSHGSWE